MNSKTTKELDVTMIDGTMRTEYGEQKATYLITELRYRKDGVRNSRTGEVFPRGYELHVDIRDRGYGKVFMSESFMLFDCISVKRHIEPANAFSAKRFAALQTDPKVLAIATELQQLALEQWTAKQAQDKKDLAESEVLAEV
jgi:hypothetical protein